MSAPDLVQAVAGYRVWIMKRGALFAPYQGDRWSPVTHARPCTSNINNEEVIRSERYQRINQQLQEGSLKITRNGASIRHLTSSAAPVNSKQQHELTANCACGLYAYHSPGRAQRKIVHAEGECVLGGIIAWGEDGDTYRRVSSK